MCYAFAIAQGPYIYDIHIEGMWEWGLEICHVFVDSESILFLNSSFTVHFCEYGVGGHTGRDHILRRICLAGFNPLIETHLQKKNTVIKMLNLQQFSVRDNCYHCALIKKTCVEVRNNSRTATVSRRTQLIIFKKQISQSFPYVS